MKVLTKLRQLIFPFFAIILTASCLTGIELNAQKAAPKAAVSGDDGGHGGVGRGDNGQVLRVSVTLNGKPVAKAIVKVTVGDGSVVLSGVTLANGTFSRSLNAGIYNVTATSGKNTAATSITIVQSNDPDMVPLALTPSVPPTAH